jgi:hypothetical protein
MKPQYSFKSGAAVISAHGLVQRKNHWFVAALSLLMITSTACSSEPEPEPVPTRHYTWRAITGVSMGGGASAMFGLKYPEKFDFIGIMGGPLVDLSSFARMVERGWLGGFCSLERLEELMAAGNDLDNVDAFCGLYTEQPNEAVLAQAPVAPLSAYPEGAEPIYEAVSDYNNWWRGPEGGRGGSFNRQRLMDSFHDILKGLGNSFYPPNDELPWAAPGITKAWWSQSAEERCANPMVFENVYNVEYNPRGLYPVITFCDGRHDDPDGTPEAELGRILPDTPRTQPVGILLAVDLNRNGRRDYAEPVIVNGYERYSDLGPDGLASVDEPGYDADTNPDPNGDDFHVFDNPAGLEGNWQHDDGEPFDDYGLDGVAGTSDFGEGNDTYDESPGRQNTRANDPGSMIESISDEQLARLTIYMDAGIRDFLNTAITSNRLWARLQARLGKDATQEFHDFDELAAEGSTFNPNVIAGNKLSKYSYMRYGSLDPSPDLIAAGDGNHVGTVPQVISRIQLIMSIAQGFWPRADLSYRRSPVGDPGYIGQDEYMSQTLGRTQTYSYVLPPGYNEPEYADEDYPVLYFLHGQGMDHEGTAATGILFQIAMSESQMNGQSDWTKFIIIFPNGECPEATADQPEPCHSGNFWTDFVGGSPETQFQSDFLELMDVVDDRYRTRAPEEIPLSEVPN